MKNCRARFSWCDLPPELLSEIAIRTATRPDLCNFRSVCKSWNNSVSPSLYETKHLLDSVFPYKIINTDNIWQKLLSLPTDQYEYETAPLVVVPVSVCLLRPATDPTQRPWLVCTEELNPGKLFLRQPLSRSTYNNLPAALAKNLDLSSLTVTQLFKGYYIRVINPGGINSQSKCTEICKVVLYTNPDCVLKPFIENFTLILLHSSGYLLAIRMSNGGNNVCNIRVAGNKNQTKFVDVVNFRGEIYAVDRKGVIYTINYHNLSVKRITQLRLNKNSIICYKLVVSSDENELYMACQDSYCISIKCRVYNRIIRLYKLDLTRKRLIAIKSLGDDKILFMTCNGCFFASVKEFTNWKGNCIVTCNCGFRTCAGCLPDNLSSCNIWIRMYYYQEPRDRNILLTDNGWVIVIPGFEDEPSSLDYSSVFWPPPSWLLRCQAS